MPVNVNIRIPSKVLLMRFVGLDFLSLIIGVDVPGVSAARRPWLSDEARC